MGREYTRFGVARNAGIRVVAGLYAAVLIVFVLPFAAIIWAMWYVIHILGQFIGNTWAFNNGPGMHFSNNLLTWMKSNLRIALWGNAARPYVQWLPSTKYGGNR